MQERSQRCGADGQRRSQMLQTSVSKRFREAQPRAHLWSCPPALQSSFQGQKTFTVFIQLRVSAHRSQPPEQRLDTAQTPHPEPLVTVSRLPACSGWLWLSHSCSDSSASWLSQHASAHEPHIYALLLL